MNVGEIKKRLSSLKSDAYIKEDSRGRVNEVYLEYEWNARQIVQEYGVDALSDKVKRAYDNNEDTKFKVVHAVYPMKEKDARGFTYESVHCLLEEKHELKRHGFKKLPFVGGNSGGIF